MNKPEVFHEFRALNDASCFESPRPALFKQIDVSDSSVRIEHYIFIG